MNQPSPAPLKARKVVFDLANSPVHWLPDDPVSSQLINGIHLLLPAGELWFCRVYNEALPHVTDAQLREQVVGFIRQEGSHAQAHRKGEAWLRDNGYQVTAFRAKVDWIFEQFLGEHPFAFAWLKGRMSAQQWLLFRLGVVAAIEHFTGLLGDWCMNSTGWDQGDPVIADLFRWHLAEEVEHRTVAFDLYTHLCDNGLRCYLGRQLIMALVAPLFFYFVGEAGRSLSCQDSDPRLQQRAGRSALAQILALERIGRQTDHVPTLSFILRRTLRWLSPRFHPIHEGDTAQALAYIARSPAAQAAG